MLCGIPPARSATPPERSRGRLHREDSSLRRPFDAGVNEDGRDIPLAIDLDGTLCLTDTLIEQGFRALAAKPWVLPRLIASQPRRLAAFKQRLGVAMPLDPGSLVYSADILALMAEARGDGRKVVLVTASDQSVGETVAAHVGGFDAVFGSDGVVNLKGEAKARFLEARFGRGCFDYAGDSWADIPVWHVARRALMVRPNAALAARVRAGCRDVVILVGGPGPGPRAKILARALRVHQWAKNLLIFVPCLAAHSLHPATLAAACVAFAAFSLSASSVYLLNDLIDLPHDRAHPTKRLRPFASGTLPLGWGLGLILLLVACSLALAQVLPAAFALLLLGYLGCTLSYSLVLKRHAVWDVMLLAGLYVIRIFAGAAATATPVSPWLLAFSMFLFFCLALVKRLAELVRLARPGRDGRAGGRGYGVEDIGMLRSMAASSGTMAVMVLALYVDSSDVPMLYRNPLVLWGLCPILLFWVNRVLMLSDRGLMDEDPVVFALRDRVSLLAGLAVGVVILAATW